MPTDTTVDEQDATHEHIRRHIARVLLSVTEVGSVREHTPFPMSAYSYLSNDPRRWRNPYWAR